MVEVTRQYVRELEEALLCYKTAVRNVGNRLRIECQVRTDGLAEAPEALLAFVYALVESGTTRPNPVIRRSVVPVSVCLAGLNGVHFCCFCFLLIFACGCGLIRALARAGAGADWVMMCALAGAIVRIPTEEALDVFEKEHKWLSGMAISAVSAYTTAGCTLEQEQQLYCQMRESWLMYLYEGTWSRACSSSWCNDGSVAPGGHGG